MVWGKSLMLVAGGVAAGFFANRLLSRTPEGAVELGGFGASGRARGGGLTAVNRGHRRPQVRIPSPQGKRPERPSVLGGKYRWSRVSDAHVRQMEGTLNNLIPISAGFVPKQVGMWLNSLGGSYYRGGNTNRFYYVYPSGSNTGIQVLFQGDHHPTYGG